MNFELSRASQAELNRTVQKLTDLSGKEAKDVLTSQMRLFAADLAFNTFPIGKGSDAQKRGQAKIAARIGSIYKTPGSAHDWLKRKSDSLGRAFARMIREKKFTEAAELVNKHFSGEGRYKVGPFDGGELHEKQQWRSKLSEVLIVTDDFRKVERYMKAKQKLVGFNKGGFATAARELGGVRGIPGYATRQRTPGRGSVTGSGSTLTVSIENHSRSIDKALDPAGEQRAINHRKRAVDLTLKRQMDAKMKKISKALK